MQLFGGMSKYLNVPTADLNQETLCARCKHPLASHFNVKHNAKKDAAQPCHRNVKGSDTRCSCKGFVVSADAELSASLAEALLWVLW